MTILILYETKHSNEIYSEEYITLDLTEGNSTKKELNELRQQIVSQVLSEFSIIGNKSRLRQFKNNKPDRVNTEEQEKIKHRESNERRVTSFPCTPKTKEKAYEFFRESQEDVKELVDNIYFDSIARKVDVQKKPIKDECVQTIPIMKLEEFKEKLLGRKESEKKLFAESSSLPIIGDKIASLAVLNEIKETSQKEDINQHTELYEKKLSTTEFQDTLKIVQIDNEIISEKNTNNFEDQEEEKYRVDINDYEGDWEEKDVFGSFARDETDAILIMKTNDGKLIDKRGRNVNNFGYLIDKNGNIVSTEGKFVMDKEEFDAEMGKSTFIEEEVIKEEPKINTLIEENNDEKIIETRVLEVDIGNNDKPNKRLNVAVNIQSTTIKEDQELLVRNNEEKVKRTGSVKKSKKNNINTINGHRVFPSDFRWNNSLMDNKNNYKNQ